MTSLKDQEHFLLYFRVHMNRTNLFCLSLSNHFGFNMFKMEMKKVIKYTAPCSSLLPSRNTLPMKKLTICGGLKPECPVYEHPYQFSDVVFN